MAVNNIEIEIKIPVEEKTLLNIREKLQKIAKTGKVSHQSDTYFSPIHRDFVEPKYPFEWLSIRKRAGKTILNYKHWYPENTEVTTHCDEFETEISEKEHLERIFSRLNFRNLVTVEKERETYVFNDEFEIALDKVNELGYFIEIEIIKEFESIGNARGKLFEFAECLGLDSLRTEKRGYPFLLMKKKGLIK